MSLFGIDNFMSQGSPQDMLAKMRATDKTSQDPKDFIQSLVKRRDGDGDGFLNLAETGLTEDRFGQMDADGDGLLSSDELGAQMREMMDRMNSMMGQLAMLMQSRAPGNSAAEIAASIVKEKDADGDGLLNLDETGMSARTFADADADGDGFVSAEELGAGIEQAAEALGPMGGPGVGMHAPAKALSDETSSALSEPAETSEALVFEESAGAGALIGSGGSGGSVGSDDAESEEDYDAYDLNKDGVVSSEEYMQAFENGDMSLADMFPKGPNPGQSLTRRLAFEAYNAQASL